MKHLQSVIFLASLAIAAVAAPNFVTPSMIRRNGLTDEQYEELWAAGRNPQIDAATARDWVYRASRYSNCTNWLAEIGATNNFAALVVPMQKRCDEFAASNCVISATLAKTQKRFENLETRFVALNEKHRILDTLYTAHTNRTAQTVAIFERLRDAAILPTTKKIYQDVIDLLVQD